MTDNTKLSWPDEIQKWDHISDLKYSVAVGTEAERIKALKADADIYLINRENVQWLIEKSGLPFDYDMVVVDELSSFKNHQSKRFKALMKVRPKVHRIVGLTGTPSSNGLMDLFAEYKLLDKGERLGRFIGQYRERYFKPDKANGPIVYSYKLLPGAEEAIYERISDITISMKSADHLKMPELVNSRYTVHLDKKELLKYVRMKQDLLLKLPKGEVTAANAAALSGKLVQMANGAVYMDDGSIEEIHSRKLDALEDIIESACGNPVLVAYWYQHDLDRIVSRLEEIGIDYCRLDKDANIRRWNAGEVSVGLIHPASAGHGLNLQSGGNILVWFGLTWSLELYQQTVADKNPGFEVYDWNGKQVYPEVAEGAADGMTNADCPFLVKVSIDDLNIRKGAGTNTAKTGICTGVGVFTIMEVRSGKGSDAGWGRLKSGAGWISLDYCQKV